MWLSSVKRICEMKIAKALLVLLLVWSANSYQCPEKDVCSCEGVVLNCKCNARQNVTLTPILNFDIRQVYVKGCGKVTIKMDTFLFITIDVLDFKDIRHLIFGSFAVSGVISEISLSDVSHLEIERHAFVDVKKLKSFALRNVVLDALRTKSFHALLDVKDFIIENSSFNVVESKALVLKNVTNFLISHLRANQTKPHAFQIHDARSVVIHESYFQSSDSFSFSFSAADSVLLSACNFYKVNSSFFLTENVQNMTFQNCTFQELLENAFLGVFPEKYLTFENNVITSASEASLFPSAIYNASKQQELRLQIFGNNFTCDCEISWMWKKEYSEVFDAFSNTSHCSNVDFQISSLTPVFDHTGNCTRLDLLNYSTLSPDVSPNPVISRAEIQKTISLDILLFGWGFIFRICRLLGLLDT